jgi:hypothetical protein
MEKRYQVFVSSTYEDLREERQEVMQALLELDCIPTGMELFPATDEDSWTLIKNLISECDYYVLIVGGRYGSLGPGGKSYTEMEYEHAVEAGIPVLAFLPGDPTGIPSGKTESTDQGRTALAEFKKKIEARRHCRFWNSPKDLRGLVSRGIANLKKTKPGVSWVRANFVRDESAAQEILKLRDRIVELESQIKEDSLTPPEGAEDLAHGDESTSLNCSFQSQGRYQEQPFELTWNEILALIGPVLLCPVTESALTGKIEEGVQNQAKDRGLSIYSVSVRDEDFQRVNCNSGLLG